MGQRIRWNVLLVLVVLGQAFGQVVRVEEVFFADSAGASPGQPAKQGAISMDVKHWGKGVPNPTGFPSTTIFSTRRTACCTCCGVASSVGRGGPM